MQKLTSKNKNKSVIKNKNVVLVKHKKIAYPQKTETHTKTAHTRYLDIFMQYPCSDSKEVQSCDACAKLLICYFTI